MKQTHLVPRKSGNTYLFHFRNRIPKDLIQYFGGRRQFQISLKDVSSKETLLVSITLKQILKEIFQDIRDGMKELTGIIIVVHFRNRSKYFWIKHSIKLREEDAGTQLPFFLR
jgi:hypothetical protein